MERLRATLHEAAGAQGSACLLVGPSGVGKSRLVSEAAQVGARLGFQVLKAQSYAVDRDLAYTPFVRMLGPYLAGLSPMERAELTQGLDPLGQILMDSGLEPPRALGDPALQKMRLFEAVVGLCARMAARGPLLLAFEDVHFADSPSIALIAYLARAVPVMPALLLATCNADHVEQAPELLAAVRSLRRSRLLERLDIGPLEKEELTQVVSDLLDGEPPQALLALLDRTGGIPLFALEWTGDLLESGQLAWLHGAWVLDASLQGEVPPRVQDLLAERLYRLPREARAVLELVAANGGEMEHALLIAVAKSAPDELEAVLGQLVTSRLLSERITPQGLSFAVSHPLIAETAYADLPAVRRQRCHLAIIEALEGESEERQLLLAFHYRAVGPAVRSPRALAALVAAGEREAELQASREAAAYFGAALQMVQAGVPIGRPDGLPWLLSRLADARERSGQYEAAVENRREAIELYALAGLHRPVALLRWRSAITEWARGRHDVAWGHLEEGIAALDDAEVSPEHVILHHAEVIFLARLGRRDAMAAAVGAARRAADLLGDPSLSAMAHLAEVIHIFDGPNPGGSRFPKLQQAIALVEATGDGESIFRACVVGAVAGHSMGYHRAARDYAQRAMAAGRSLGALAMEVFGLGLAVASELSVGRWQEADRLGARLVALQRRTGIARETAVALSIWTCVLARRGETAVAEACLAEVHEVYGESLATDVHTMSSVRLAQLTLALESGRVEAVRFGPADVPQELHATAFAQRMGGIAEVLVLQGDTATAHQVLLHLEEDDSPLAQAMVFRVRGLLAQHAGDVAGAAACFASAAAAFERLEMPAESAEARLDRVELLWHRQPSLDEAEELTAFFRRLGSPRLTARAARLAGPNCASAQVPDPESGDAGQSLTPRQWEIAGLVALGLTNAEIAERLSISVRTVTTHLSHIFDKLDLNSRTALVRHVLQSEEYLGKGA